MSLHARVAGVLAVATTVAAVLLSSGHADAAAERPMTPLTQVNDLTRATFTTTADDVAARTASPAAAVPRLAGADRYETAVTVSMRAFPERADVVYLARADRIGDALAGGALTDGPVLLVPATGSVPPAVTEEIERLGPTSVIAIGGTAAVSDTVLRTAADGTPTSRIAGADAAGTAAAIARRAFPEGAQVVYLARQGESPDAVAGGVLTDGPVLSVPANAPVPSATREAIRALTPARVIALGGAAAVPEDVLEEAAQGARTGRLDGADRYATALAIATHAFPEGSDVAYLTSGVALADAVAGGALTDGPLLLTPPPGSPAAATVASALADLDAEHLGIVGGQVSLPDTSVEAVLHAADLAGGPLPGGFPGATGPAPGLTCDALVRTFRPIALDERYTISCGHLGDTPDLYGLTEIDLDPGDGALVRGRITVRDDLTGEALLATLAHELAHAWPYAHLTPEQRSDIAAALGHAEFESGDADTSPAEVWARSQAACAGYPDGYEKDRLTCGELQGHLAAAGDGLGED